jgi:CDP-2,3-bis-(O-geranylgeranyl)-sn-glycerol synthase
VFRFAQLLYLMLPVYAANMAAPFARYWPAMARPVSERWLGGHKTWLLGDSAKSFFKRRLGIQLGSRWIIADQLDFVVAGLLALMWWVDLGWLDVTVVLALSFVGALAINRLACGLGIKRTPW